MSFAHVMRILRRELSRNSRRLSALPVPFSSTKCSISLYSLFMSVGQQGDLCFLKSKLARLRA